MTTHVHQDGVLDLRLRAVGGGRTVIAGRRQRFPLRTTVASYPDDGDPGMPFVVIQNPTGGVFPGDRLRVGLDVSHGASVHIRNQSATKLYAGEGDVASQDLHVSLGDGAVAEYLADVLIPHAGSRYRQRLSIEAAESARFIAAESVAAGRIAHGERFAFEHLRLETVVSVEGVLRCRDVLDLAPRRSDPSARGGFGGRTHLSTVLAICPADDSERIAAAADTAVADVVGARAAATVLPAGVGVMVRALSTSASEARVVVAAAWSALRRELLGRAAPARFT